jgi:carbonic anhydrase
MAATATAQHPKAVILSCLDSRVPVELVFDQGIGDIFVGRVAGNIEDEDQLGSMEFATKLAGAKLVMVLGHLRCGAVNGAADGAKLGNLTALLAKIRPAVDAVEGFKPEERNSSNAAFMEKAIEENVRMTVADIRKSSPVLAELEKAGDIKIVGAMYDLNTGKVELLE